MWVDLRPFERAGELLADAIEAMLDEKEWVRLAIPGGSALDGFLQHPMIWWWVPPTDANMETLHLAGALLGAAGPRAAEADDSPHAPPPSADLYHAPL